MKTAVEHWKNAIGNAAVTLKQKGKRVLSNSRSPIRLTLLCASNGLSGF